MSYDPNAAPQGPATPDAGGLPPELQAIIAAAAGGGAGASADPTAAPQDPNAQGGDSPEAKPLELIRQMIDAAKQYIDVEPDEEDKLTMTKVMQQLQQYLAKDQKDEEDMLSGNISARAMRKASVGG